MGAPPVSLCAQSTNDASQNRQLLSRVLSHRCVSVLRHAAMDVTSVAFGMSALVFESRASIRGRLGRRSCAYIPVSDPDPDAEEPYDPHHRGTWPHQEVRRG